MLIEPSLLVSPRTNSDSQMSITPSMFASIALPSAISQLSRIPLPSQSVPLPRAMSQVSARPFMSQSVPPGTSTVIVCVAVAKFPNSSIAVQVTTVMPIG